MHYALCKIFRKFPRYLGDFFFSNQSPLFSLLENASLSTFIFFPKSIPPVFSLEKRFFALNHASSVFFHMGDHKDRGGKRPGNREK